MEPAARHSLPPDVSFDGGGLDCGNGLLLEIRRHIDPLRQGQLLEILSTETSVEEELPAWCRMISGACFMNSHLTAFCGMPGAAQGEA